MKRRIRWQEQSARSDNPDGTACSWRWFKRSSYREKLTQGHVVSYDWDDWYLSWDSIPVNRFDSEELLKCYIIRFVYGIESAGFAIPSELLREAGMRYVRPIWVDEWYATSSPHTSEASVVHHSLENPEWAPSKRNLRVEGRRPKKKPNVIPQGEKNNFLRLEKRKGASKGELVPVKAPKVNISRSAPPPKVSLPDYDRVLRKSIPCPGFTPIRHNWEDFSWESRPGRPLCVGAPEIQPSDDSCITVLTAEIGFEAPKRKTAKKSKKA